MDGDRRSRKGPGRDGRSDAPRPFAGLPNHCTA
jgi:hypothetical protein